MKLFRLLPTILFIIMTSFSLAQNNSNPFFSEWNTPFNTPPFNEIRTEHYLPAFNEGIKQQKAEIEVIAKNPEEPDFVNTIEAMDVSGKMLTKVNLVFSNLYDADSKQGMDLVAQESASLLSGHRDDIYLNDKLFKRVKAVHDKKDELNLTPEQKTVLESYYLDFIEGGANLDETGKGRLRKINEELSKISIVYGENVRNENNAFGLVINNESELTGIPSDIIQGAKEKADAKGLSGKWILTIDKPTLIPCLQSASDRSIREKLYNAYMNRGNNNNEFDNKKILARIISLRTEKAHLLGYKTFAEYKLKRKMAKTPANVYNFLNNILPAAMDKGREEVAEMQKLINEEGKDFKLEPWDYWYYSEKLNQKKYNVDEEMFRPYFKLDNVLQGAFTLANKLYGITFTERKDMQVYNPEVQVFEVKEADGRHIGILYTDYFPRESKRNGAWQNNYTFQSNVKGNFVYPVVCLVGNFTRPMGNKPSLLSFDDVSTLFHEFGHALHYLFQNVAYPKSAEFISDFVEFPSQIMENWALHPEVLKLYAKHYQTGDPMSPELMEKVKEKSRKSTFETIEYTAASILDMDWHSNPDTIEQNVTEFEQNSIKKMGLILEILPRYMSTNFLHIASWGYESGYYSYQWSAVLDADAFEAFKEKGIFDKTTAASLRKNILEKGSSEDLMSLYVKFRGREPEVDPLLRRLGLKD